MQSLSSDDEDLGKKPEKIQGHPLSVRADPVHDPGFWDELCHTGNASDPDRSHVAGDAGGELFRPSVFTSHRHDLRT